MDTPNGSVFYRTDEGLWYARVGGQCLLITDATLKQLVIRLIEVSAIRDSDEIVRASANIYDFYTASLAAERARSRSSGSTP